MSVSYLELYLHGVVWVLPLLVLGLAFRLLLQLREGGVLGVASYSAEAFSVLYAGRSLLVSFGLFVALLTSSHMSAAALLSSLTLSHASLCWVWMVYAIFLGWLGFFFCSFWWAASTIPTQVGVVLLAAPAFASVWALVGSAAGFLTFFFYLEVAAMLLLVCLAAISLATGVSTAGELREQLRVYLYLLWANAFTFIFFFYAVSLGLGWTLSLRVTTLFLLVDVTGVTSGVINFWV
jgi:hypothetical protein